MRTRGGKYTSRFGGTSVTYFSPLNQQTLTGGRLCQYASPSVCIMASVSIRRPQVQK